MTNADEQKSLASLKPSILLEAVAGNVENISPFLALNEFIGRKTGDRVEQLTQVLNKQEDPELLAVAIRGLSLQVDPCAQKALLGKLSTCETGVRRQILFSLGKIGDQAALKKLENLALEDSDSLLTTQQFAKRLIAFRCGLQGYEFKSHEYQRADNSKQAPTREITSSPIPNKLLKFHKDRLNNEVPGIEFSQKGAIEFSCLKKDMWLILNKELETDAGFEKLKTRPYIPMVVMAYAYCTDRPYLYGYVFSQPSDAGVELMITRLRGQITHMGAATLCDKSASFELQALKTRFAPEGVLKGTFHQTKEALTQLNGSDFKKMGESSREPKIVQSTEAPVQSLSA